MMGSCSLLAREFHFNRIEREPIKTRLNLYIEREPNHT